MRKSRLVLAALFVVLVSVLSLPINAVNSAKLEKPISGEAVQPNWDRLQLRACALNWDGQGDFNVYYTCTCLYLASETDGEAVSAKAQCDQAISYYW